MSWDFNFTSFLPELILLVFVVIHQQGATKYPNGRIQFNLYVFNAEKWRCAVKLCLAIVIIGP